MTATIAIILLLLAVVIALVVTFMIQLSHRQEEIERKQESFDTGLTQATRLAIAANSRIAKTDNRCDGITARITAIIRLNKLSTKPTKD